MAVNDRIKEARLKARLTQEQLAVEIGVAKSTLAGYEKGSREPNMLTMSKIMETLNIDANYLYQDEMGPDFHSKLAYGELEHVKKYRIISEKNPIGKEIIDYIVEKELARCETPKPTVQPAAFEEDRESLYNVVTFPHPDNRVSAGFGDDFLNDDNVTMVTAIANRDTIRADFCIEVDGHSMEPLYHDGDLVLVHKQPAIDVGAIGIFAANDKAYIKQQGEDRLVSLNHDYPDVEPEESYEYKCFGEVIGILDPEWIVE